MGKFVIQSDAGEFWTGTSWAKEYPDALTFSSFAGACAEARRWQLSKVRHVVKNYGFDSEQVLATYPEGQEVVRG